MGEFFDERELERNVKVEPHDYGKDIENLDKKMRSTQFNYIDVVLKRLKKVKRRAIALLVIGVALAAIALLTSNILPDYDMDAYIFLNNILPIEHNPILAMLAMIVPAAVVFVFLVWLYNREAKMYFYLAKKVEAKGTKARFVSMLAAPFLLLSAAIACSALLLFLFSLLNCQFVICHFYTTLDRFSSNMLFNLLSLAFYLIFLGSLQLKRYIVLVSLGIKDFYKDLKL